MTVEPLFADVNDDLVAQLENLLVEAKSGKLANMAYAAITNKGSTLHCWSHCLKNNTGNALMAAIAVLQHDYARSRLEIAKEAE